MESLLLPETVTKPPQVTSPAPQAKLPEEEAGDRRMSRLGTWKPEQEQEQQQQQLRCPRCHSTNTKFCYFNNYSLSQPRHFCKSCRRYWTRGGALRNVPVGRGTRKASSSNKRLRIATSSTTAVSSNGNSLAASGKDIDVVGQTQTTDPLVPNSLSGLDSGSSLNASAKAPVAKSEGLSWWSEQMGGVEVDLLPINGDVLGLGPGVGFEPGFLDWTTELGGGGDGDALVDLTGDSLGCNVEVGRRR